MKTRSLIPLLISLVILSACTAPTPAPQPSPTPPKPQPTDPDPRPPETIAIYSPQQGAEISGGVIYVEGYAEYFFEGNLGMALCVFEEEGPPHHLCGTPGGLLAQSYATIASPDIGLPGPFNGEIRYTVTEPTQARLVVYAASPRDGGLEHLSSVWLTLMP